MHGQPKKGFTLVELLVVIAIIGALVALIIPAVMSARLRALDASCKQNLKNMGTAFAAYESNKQHFPPSIFEGSSGETVNWVYALFPYTDQLARKDQIASSPTGFADASGRIASLVCPVDPTDSGSPLSYAMNCGLFGTTTEGSGIGYDKTAAVYFTVASDDVYDGRANTILVGERPSPDGVVVGVTAPQWNAVAVEMVGLIWQETATPAVGFGQHVTPSTPPIAAVQIDFARPASLHGQTVNVLMADGAVVSIRNNIDYTTYCQLMTYDSNKLPASSIGIGVVDDASYSTK